jgi:hydroxymethylbilane synthase
VTRTLRIGTRGSDLALWQARHVAAKLAALPEPSALKLVVIQTAGDRVTDVPLSRVEGKAFFTKEIEEALRAGRVDLAVHSLKDLPTELPPGLALGAVLQRDDPRDALLARDGAGFEALAAGARVGTSSLRRRAFLARWRSDLALVELRGNVPTRLRKLDEGRLDAVVLAAAGVRRLELAERITELLPLERVLPAPGQGAVAVEVRAGDAETLALVRRLDHLPTRYATDAERALLRRLEGGCSVPVGALAAMRGDALELWARIASLDGARAVEGVRSGPADYAEAIGSDLAGDLLRQGGEAILAEIRATVPKGGGG